MNWKEAAAKAIQAGYQPGNQWERQLSSHLRRLFPQLVVELRKEGNYKAYLVVQTQNALNLLEHLENRGLNQQSARELALDQLLQKTPDDLPKAEPWESEEVQADIQEAVLRHLLLRKS